MAETEAGSMKKPNPVDGVIVEFHQVGNAVKVSAVDTKTYLEVSIMAPVTATEKEMTDIVLRKLAYVQARKKADGTVARAPSKPRL